MMDHSAAQDGLSFLRAGTAGLYYPLGWLTFLSSPPVVTSAAFLIPNQLHFVEELNLKINSSSSRIKGSENHAILAGFPVTI